MAQMTEAQWQAWLRDRSYRETTQTLIRRIRDSEPSRRVEGGQDNVSGFYNSGKMGLTIQFESRTLELVTLWYLEDETHVLEYYDQPEPIALRYQAPSGRRVTAHHTPDLFVLWDDHAGWLECKPTETLEKLALSMPNRYVRTDHGWTCPPAESLAHEYGLTYRLITEADLDVPYLRNQQFLAPYRRAAETYAPKRAARDAILRLIAQNPGLALARLLEAVDPDATADDVYWLVTHDELYIDLHAAPLAEPHRVAVFPNETWAQHLTNAAPQPGARISLVSWEVDQPLQWAGEAWTVANVGGDQVFLQHVATGKVKFFPVATLDEMVQTGILTGFPVEAPGPLSPTMRHATSLAVTEAARQIRILSGEETPAQAVADRTRRHWARRMRLAVASGRLPIVGLVPQYALRGNHTARIPAAHEELLTQAIQDYYEVKNRPSIRAAWRLYCTDAETAGFTPVSYPTFVTRVHHQPRTRQKTRREGKRAAYDTAPQFWHLDRNTPPHGDHPWEVLHIDHTRVDTQAVAEATGERIGRPWLTLIMDAYDRRIPLHLWSYQAPSATTTLLALRLLVQQYHRFPQRIVVDHGKDFQSRAFDLLIAAMGPDYTKLVRPPAQPRFGSPLERFFGVTNTQFLHLLTGNTQAAKEPRQMTRSHDPRRHAVWTLGMLREGMDAFLAGYHDRIHPALGTTPNQRHHQGLARTGERSMTWVTYDTDFVMFTHPTTSKGTAKIQPGRGIKILHHYFWSPAFVRPGVEGTTVDVRYDALDMSKAWARVKGQWVTCQAATSFAGRSVWEIQQATEEIRQQDRMARTSGVSERQLREWLLQLRASDELAQQRQKDRELRNVLSPESSTVVVPQPAPIITRPQELTISPLVDYGEVE